MAEVLRREAVYLWYYLSVQLEQIAPYWLAGVALGSLVSVFGKSRLSALFERLGSGRLGALGLLPASLIGIASPLCMYGTIPIAASFSEKGMRDDYLAAFMVSSALLNPQLLVYSAALGRAALVIRFASCLVCGAVAGLLVRALGKGGHFFRFEGFAPDKSRDADPRPLVRFLKSVWRNIRATAPWFALGILLTALWQRYVPSDFVADLFGDRRGFGVLMAAALGVPLYMCGGGTIPLIQEWLWNGMSMGAAAAFMITGPATKLTNLGALKAVLGARHFACYIAYIAAFALATGLLTNALTP